MPGAAFMAARTGAPVIPTWIEGSFKAFPRGGSLRLADVRVRYGQPLHFKKSEGRNAGRIRSALMALARSSQSGNES